MCNVNRCEDCIHGAPVSSDNERYCEIQLKYVKIDDGCKDFSSVDI